MDRANVTIWIGRLARSGAIAHVRLGGSVETPKINPIAAGNLQSHTNCVIALPSSKPPSKRKIGCRIRVKREHAEEAATLFANRGFTPIWVEHREDGNISFWFGKAPGEVLFQISQCIPREFYAIQGIIVGSSFNPETLSKPH